MTNNDGDPTRPGGDGGSARKPSAIIDMQAVESDPLGSDVAEETAPGQSEPTGSGRPSGPALSTLLTYAAAGMAGGILALVAALALAPMLGQTQGPSEASAQSLERRLRAIEASTAARASGASQELTQKLAAAEQRLARLEDAARKSTPAGESLAKLAVQVKALEDGLAKPGTGGDAQGRLVKLEERLEALSAGRPTEGGGSERIDRELAEVKAATARFQQRIDALKAAGDRLEPSLRALQEETAGLKAELARELKSVARAQDVSRSLAPVAGKLSTLEQGLESLAKSELDRKANTERIVLALELGNLKRVMERGVPYAIELAEVSKVSGGKLNLAVLERYKTQGVPPVTELAREFRGITHAVIEADAEQADASILDRLLAGAKSIVRVRRVSHAAGDNSAEAVVARMEAGIKDGSLALVIESAKQLSPKAKEPARAWLEKVEARAAVDRAIGDIDAELKASLGAGAQADRRG